MRSTVRPLVITADPEILDDLLRLVSVAGAEADVVIDPAGARSRFGTAPLVLIGADQAPACMRARFPRRRRVVFVARDGATAEQVNEFAPQFGAEFVAVLPIAEPWLVDLIADCHSDASARPGRVVTVVGGRGGAGASTLAAGLATTAVRAGKRTLLIDADPLGGGLDLVLGWETVQGLRWPSLVEASGRVDEAALVRELPGRGDLVVLSWGRADRDGESPTWLPAEAMAATLDAGRRGRDLIVVDLPRRLDDTAMVALAAADLALMVIPAELRAAAAAARFAVEVLRHRDSLDLIVRGPSPGNLRPEEVAKAVGLPLAGVLRPEPGLDAALERGEAPAASGRGPLAELCTRLLKELP
ncbi:secretion/DNA translocation related CpaE-like protein [Allocatelliglobosispora scoriae]|uniref:Secretion/DNA translocation related CpaE-like protein n=1 Tax=Allocatelliglobosispora scoriae TaxID=643052 RepID=A0A841BX19_9ACTN|nr:secretion/DNA translocation related CpaE-like protein [Allocatelliglobosispora scoriae]